MNITACLMAFASLVFGSSAFAAQPAKFSFFVVARVADPTRTHEVRMEGQQEQVPSDKAFRLSKEDVQVELTPKFRDAENVSFAYRVTRKGAALSAGELQARVGQKTHLLAGDKKSGYLVNLAVRIPGESVPFGRMEPRLLKDNRLGRGRYTPL